MVTDARVVKVSLTGSVPTEKKASAAAQLKLVTMELSGKSTLEHLRRRGCGCGGVRRDPGLLLLLGSGLFERHSGVCAEGH